MKHMRKIFALMLAVVMTLAMSVTAFADDPTTYAISVDTTKNKADHTYKVYQIFTGTPDGDKLVNVKYGSSYAGKTAGDLVPGADLKAIETQNDARAWIEANKGTVLGTEVAELNSTNTSYNAVPGWYVILDTDYDYSDPRTEEDTDAYSAYIVEVVNAEASIKPKSVAPTVDKKVVDQIADAEEGATDGWGESADHKIGETFQFRLTATLPADEDYSAYDTYPITFNDTMSSGVTFEKIDSVTVDNNTITSGYSNTAQAGQKGGSWTLSFTDLKTIDGVDLTDGAEVVVVYSAHLNSDAIVHQESVAQGGVSDTNNNKVSLTYSNNPDATGTGTTDTTPEDYVWVFTYNVTGEKVDTAGNPVAGAGFTLKNGTTAVQLYKVGTTYYVYDSTKTDYPTGGEVVTEILTTDAAAGNKFDIRGLDVGEYTLEETKVPDGYSKCADIAVKIDATHKENDSKDTVALTLTTQGVNNTIENKSGATLPETGGIGTTMFYAIGMILVIGAGVVLVTRRRMAK